MKTKVGILLPSLNNGGAERVASRLSVILQEDYEVYLIVFSNKYMKYNFGGELINLNTDFAKGKKDIIKRIGLLVKRIIRLKKVKKKYELHSVISFMDSPNIINILSKDKSTMTVTSIRNFDFNERNKFLKSVYKIIYKQADYIITVTKHIQQAFSKIYNIPERKIVTIYNPFDLHEIKKESEENLDNKQQRLFSNSNFKFISVGRLTYQKGFWHLIKSFNLVLKEYTAAELFIIGRDESNGEVERLIYNMGLEEKVHLLGSQKNPFKFIKRCDAYVMSSLFEGFPNSLVEAMALAKPVISTDCNSGPKEILSDKFFKPVKEVTVADYGILVPQLDKEVNLEKQNYTEEEKKLSQAMLLLIRDENLQNKLSQKSITRAKKYNYEVCKKEYEKVLEIK